MTPSDEAFDAWIRANWNANGGAPLVARAAWDAALAYAAKQARDAQKRYACKRMRGVCRGIADSIKKEGAD